MAVVAPSFASFHNLDNPSRYGGFNMDQPVGSVQLVPNPHFVFPMQPSPNNGSESPSRRRPVSMQLPTSPHQSRSRAQRQSASTLPTFTFNATDTSGLAEDPAAAPTTPPVTSTTPSKSMGHRRGVSEFVGGDSRLGVSNLLSSSPSKHVDMFPIAGDAPTGGSPARKRGHAHRRSAAISGHDLSTILQPRDVNVPSHMGSAPQTPTDRAPSSQYFTNEKAGFDAGSLSDGFESFATGSSSPERSTARSPSRPRVGFSENVEYIPRPLSIISSDTTSSASTIRGHSVGNSISSVINAGGFGAPSPKRTQTPPITTTSGVAASGDLPGRDMASVPELGAPDRQSKRLFSDSFPTSPDLTADTDVADTPRLPPKKKSLFKLDRRRSEPSISVAALQHSRLSSISLQEPITSHGGLPSTEDHDTALEALRWKSSRKTVKEWATAFLGRKARDPKKTKSTASELCTPSPPAEDSEGTQSVHSDPDLDALFSQDPSGGADEEVVISAMRPKINISPMSSFSPVPSSRYEGDDLSPVIDLDAALGPYGTPSMKWETKGTSSSAIGRRQLHSDRMNKTFANPSTHTQQRLEHKRTMSAPATAFTPFDFPRASSPNQSPMADVFEEEEEEETEAETDGKQTTQGTDHEELGTGIQIVDAVTDNYQSSFGWRFENGLGMEGNRGTGPAGVSSNGPPSHFPSPSIGRRTSVLDDVIIEESSPVEIVEDYEEPRTSSATKASDSSEASTILPGQPSVIISVPGSSPHATTPASYATSTFPSPDLNRRQVSFDTPRLGTSASSIADNRRFSSFATGEPVPEMRMSVDDVPSLTSSRSTAISTVHHNGSRRDFSDRSGSIASTQAEQQMTEQRRKRSSIQSLSRLVSGSFGESKSKPSEQRPQAAGPIPAAQDGKKRKENRLSRLMFWRSRTNSRGDHEAM